MASPPISDTKKRLALSIIDFLSTALKDGTLSQDHADNVEVASSCIADAFGVDPNNAATVTESSGSQPLLSIFGVYEKLKGKSTASTVGSSSVNEARPSTPSAPSTSRSAPAPTTSKPGEVNPEAEKLKSAGNAAMQQKDYKTAIAKYTEAIAYSPTNPIYLSNRAAAYSASGDHAAAAADAEIAVAAEPKYTKAWSRLGLAKFAMGDARGSAEAYQKGIDYEGNGGSDAMKKGLETAKREVARMEQEESNLPEDDVDDATSPGAGAGLGAGGMPDLAGLMNNPMFAGMARNIMSDPNALGSLMSNPTIQSMLRDRREGGGGGGSGGGMPGMAQIQQLMQDPNIASLASQFMGGMGGGPGGAGGGAGAGAGGGAGRGR